MDSESRIMTALKYYVEEHYTDIGLPDMFHVKRHTAWWYTRAYENWAAHEIMDILEGDWEGEPICVTIEQKLEDLRYMFDCFAMESKPNTQMFTAAYDVATNLLDVVISMTYH